MAAILASSAAPAPAQQVSIERAWGGRIFCSTYGSDGSTDYLLLGEDGGRIRRGTRLAGTSGDFVWSDHVTADAADASVRGIALIPDTLVALAVDMDGKAWRSLDQGASWHEVADFHMELSDVCILDGGRAFIASAGGLFESMDYGTTWNAEPTGALNDEILCVDAVGNSTDHLVLVGTEGTCAANGQLLSRDMSGTWRQVASPTLVSCVGSIAECADPHARITSVCFSPASTTIAGTAFAAGEDILEPQKYSCGLVARGQYGVSSPGVWETWVSEGRAPEEFCGDETGCIPVDQFGCVLPTGIGDGTFSPKYDVYAQDDDRAIAVGYSTLSFRTVKGTWADITDKQNFPGWPIYSVTGSGACGGDEAWTFGSFGDIRHVTTVAGLSAWGFSSSSCSCILDPYPGVPYQALGPQLFPGAPPFTTNRIETFRLGSMFFLDADTGWAVGQIGRVVAWNEVQSAWVEQYSRCEKTPVTMESVFFSSGALGVAVGRRAAGSDWPIVVGTIDGGAQWTRLDDATHMGQFHGASHLLSVTSDASLSPGEGVFWAVGEAGTALRIRRDVNWTVSVVAVASPSCGGSVTLESVGNVGADTIVAVGRCSAGEGVIYALDRDAPSGPVFEQVNVPKTLPPLRSVAGIDGDVWTVGGHIQSSTVPSSAIVVRNKSFLDSPSSFTHVQGAESLAASRTLRSVALAAASVGGPSGDGEILIGGEHGTLLRSIDGGTSWVRLETHTIRPIGSVALPEFGKGWALGVRSIEDLIHTDTITLRYP